jgi:phosphoglycolate phosphatase
MDPETGIVRAGSVFAAGNSVDIVDAWYPELPGTARTGMVERIDQVFYENGIRYSVPIPGVKETLARIAEAGMAMGVATSDGTAGTRAALAVLGMQTYLPHVFGYDSVAAPKPAPDIVFAFAEAIGAHPERSRWSATTHMTWRWRGAPARARRSACCPGRGKRKTSRHSPTPSSTACADLPGWLETRGGRSNPCRGEGTGTQSLRPGCSGSVQ